MYFFTVSVEIGHLRLTEIGPNRQKNPQNQGRQYLFRKNERRRLILITLHQSGWKAICQQDSHLASWSRSFCRLYELLLFLKARYIMVSSAKSLTLGISFIQYRNRHGPSTDPCGTPERTRAVYERCSSCTTVCVLSESQFFSHLLVCPWIPQLIYEEVMANFVERLGRVHYHCIGLMTTMRGIDNAIYEAY